MFGGLFTVMKAPSSTRWMAWTRTDRMGTREAEAVVAIDQGKTWSLLPHYKVAETKRQTNPLFSMRRGTCATLVADSATIPTTPAKSRKIPRSPKSNKSLPREDSSW